LAIKDGKAFSLQTWSRSSIMLVVVSPGFVLWR